MPIVCEKIPSGEWSRKSEYVGIEEFSWVNETLRPNIPLASKWSMRPCFLSAKYERSAEIVENFQVYPDDTWLVSFPKCGTTWTQELVWQLCNFDLATESPLRSRFPFLELGCITYDAFKLDMISILQKKSPPRFIKTHLPAHLLPKQIWSVKPKIVYVTRNVKDAAVSYYHHYKNLQHYKASFEDFMDAFLTDKVVHAPYDSHVVDFWNMRNEENILFLTFEDMKRDHPSVIRKTAEFLGKSFTDEQIETLAEHLSFDKMIKNDAVNYRKEVNQYHQICNTKKDDDFNFIRKGQIGTYRQEMSAEMIERFDKWIEERLTKCKADPQVFEICNPKN
ncbi:luciferin sulfotransferase-like [Phlebotomus argentipes]|uniref:luciferin sulfotransferase-like n=1 Tax=Phlebotomus argentipes TaxID=94469 RepID=UPI00289332DF|nr:luciferin sulfotransferase-like [Phlebotomus argentipes]